MIDTWTFPKIQGYLPCWVPINKDYSRETSIVSLHRASVAAPGEIRFASKLPKFSMSPNLGSYILLAPCDQVRPSTLEVFT